MAFTTLQRAQIRYYLGYSDVSQGGAPNRLERSMTDMTADAQTIVTGLLTQLLALDSTFTSSSVTAAAGLKSVDNGGVEWFGPTSVQVSLSATGRRLVIRLSTMFGVAIATDIYASSAGPVSGQCGIG